MRATVAGALLASALLGGCGRDLVIHDIASHDTIIRTYPRQDDPDATTVISRWGDMYRKWRATSSGAALLYQVDVNTRVCWETRQIVPCENVKRDQDMRQYIDW